MIIFMILLAISVSLNVTMAYLLYKAYRKQSFLIMKIFYLQATKLIEARLLLPRDGMVTKFILQV